MTRHQQAILDMLRDAGGAVVPKDRIIATLDSTRDSVAAQICHIRRARPDLRIETIWGVGYRLPPAEARP